MHPITRHDAHETWQLRKEAIRGRGGMVVSHHYLASRAGAAVLAAGGNAVDAAVTASFVLGVVEPWMSGMGGGGYMLVRRAREARSWCIDFGMRAAKSLDPADYPLDRGADADLFGWPAVVGDRNVLGPLSIAVPGQVAGMSSALERFGSRSFAECLAPAIEHASRGLAVDWYSTLKIASEAPALARDADTAAVFLPGGHPPSAPWGGPLPRLRLGRLEHTLRRLAEAGPGDFYRGEIARSVVADLERIGARVDAADLADYEARVMPAGEASHRGATVSYAPGLTAGPTLKRALELLDAEGLVPGARTPTPSDYRALSRSLTRAYGERLSTMGEGTAPSCTTHLNVVDAEGNTVSLTQTLLSVFGAKQLLPGTGMLMNNGVMWFDPRPGGPNSPAPGRRPLSNMCPAIAVRDDGLLMAVGASGGRRILPAVFQLLHFVLDRRMDLDAAFRQGRIDASGTASISVDAALPQDVAEALASEQPVEVAHHGVYPAMFGCPNALTHDPASGRHAGCAYVTSPWGEASVVEGVV